MAGVLMVSCISSSSSPAFTYRYSDFNITTSMVTKLSRLYPKTISKTSLLLLPFLRPSFPPARFFCKSSYSLTNTPVDISGYREAFAKRMAMAGLKPHHRLALGVSGGPDSMALCALTAHWKANLAGDSGAVHDSSSGFIDGLLAIIVDHELRPESKEEAEMVSGRVSDLGIRCEIARANWSSGRPKQGHIQEAARDMRYRIFENMCGQHQIGVLLVAHHADDQAESFILRLSRSSGVLGLAGMAFVSQLYPSFPVSCRDSSHNRGIILVRPLLHFTKEDLYKMCTGTNQKWVEDPTNQSQIFARNRIRMALRNKTSCTFKSELQMLISICRRTRAYVDHMCRCMINQAVKIMDHGYIVIDLKILDPSNREDICLSKFLASVLQFISQRNRPVRSGAIKLLLDYIRSFPCKNSLTVAGCYLCPAPGTKGSKVIVCCSVNSVLPSNMELYSSYADEESCHSIPNAVDEIIKVGESCLNSWVSDAADFSFLQEVSSAKLLQEAKRLNILSESTYVNLIEMKTCETEHFRSNVDDISSREPNLQEGSGNSFVGKPFHPGHHCYFMNRFLIKWEPSKSSIPSNHVCLKDYLQMDEPRDTQNAKCSFCLAGDDISANIRHVVDADWIYLGRLAKSRNSDKCQQQKTLLDSLGKSTMEKIPCCDYAELSAQQALESLKSVPAAARRGLPVVVSPQNSLLSIPSIGFRICPQLMVSAEFRPRVPLGGGHSSFL